MNHARPIVTAGAAVLLFLVLRRQVDLAAFVAALTLGVLLGEVVLPRLVAIFHQDRELRRVRQEYYREQE